MEGGGGRKLLPQEIWWTMRARPAPTRYLVVPYKLADGALLEGSPRGFCPLEMVAVAADKVARSDVPPPPKKKWFDQDTGFLCQGSFQHLVRMPQVSNEDSFRVCGIQKLGFIIPIALPPIHMEPTRGGLGLDHFPFKGTGSRSGSELNWW